MKSEQGWVRKYPALNDLFLRQFNQRYEDLHQTIHHLLFDRMDKRVLDFLVDKSKVLREDKLDIRHHQIAKEIGTAREVVLRVLKKLENQKLIRQEGNFIEILSSGD